VSAYGYQPEDRRAIVNEAIAGFLATIAFFAAPVGVVYHPGRVETAAILVALIAAGIGGFQQRLAAWAVAITTVCWLVGMVVSITLDRPIF
jgi:hypothetical protein